MANSLSVRGDGCTNDPDHALSEDELATIEELAAAATPGPWFVRDLDDDHAANLVAVSTTRDTGRNQRWPEFDPGEMVAATLVQFPNRYVDCIDERWDQNAQFIAHARQDIPRLIAEVHASGTHLSKRAPTTERPESAAAYES